MISVENRKISSLKAVPLDTLDMVCILYFAPPLKGFPLRLGIGAGVKN